MATPLAADANNASLHLVNLAELDTTSSPGPDEEMMVLAATFISVPICCAVGFWVSTAFKKSPQASAWSAPALNSDSDAKAEGVDSAEVPGETFIPLKARLQADLVTIALFSICAIGSLSGEVNVPLASAVVGWQVGYGLPACIVLGAWASLGRPNGVSPSLLVSFFVSGSILSVLLAFVGELFEETGWSVPAYLLCRRPSALVSEQCTWLHFSIMLLSPALLEETAKACWLFVRLRRSATFVPSQCCFGFWPVNCCLTRGLYLYAPTPYHVVLAAAACGAGFEASENLTKVREFAQAAHQQGLMLDPDHAFRFASLRALTGAMHIVWTGIIGFGLARRMFLPRKQQPFLALVVLPSILLHAGFDFCLEEVSAVNQAEKLRVISREDGDNAAGFYLLCWACIALFTLVLPCCVTGCFSFDFWNRRYREAADYTYLAHLGPPRNEITRPLLEQA